MTTLTAGRELDALVAEQVMGIMHHHDSVETCLLDHDFVPHYSTSIAAAWSVVEHIRLNWIFSKRQAFLNAVDDQRVIHQDRHDKIAWPDFIFFITPEIICLAALKWAERG